MPHTNEEMKSEVGGIECQCGNPINIDRINNFWLNKISDLKKSIREEIESMQERCEECENGEIHDTNPKNIIIDEILSLKSLE